MSANSGVIGFSPFSFNPAIRLGSVTGNSDLFVAETASVWSDGFAVRTLSDFNSVANAGTITGRSAGVDLQGSNNVVSNTGEILGPNSIVVRVFAEGLIDNSGTISGRSFGAVTRDGNGTILNSGTISGRTAVFMQGDGTTNDSQLINSGDILGLNDAVFVDDSPIQIVNTGTMSASVFGIVHTLISALHLSELDNAGTITSGEAAYRGTNGVDRIDNSGSIQGDILTYDGVDNINNSGEILGDVDLGNGADIYRVTGTGQTNGLVMAGTGDDTLQGGIFDDSIDGGDGADVIRGRGGDDSITGGAQLDTISGGDGNDTLRGGPGADLLLGNAGDDLVDGGNSAFSGGGQASARTTRNNTLDESQIRIDADGDGTLDARIFLDGAVTLVETDFIL
ncbi:MAG: calcium-binding protein [Paracoccaceae bacterium]